MGVAGHDVALFHEVGEENVFGGATLMGRNHIFETGDSVDSVLKFVEGAGAGV